VCFSQVHCSRTTYIPQIFGRWFTPDSVRHLWRNTLALHVSVSPSVSVLPIGGLWIAGCYPASPAPLRRDHTCGPKTEILPELHLHDPLALLPVARSPSRTHCCIRWWALTPPFHPSPTPSNMSVERIRKLWAGLLSVAVVVVRSLPNARPHLRFREATFQPAKIDRLVGVGKFLYR